MGQLTQCLLCDDKIQHMTQGEILLVYPDAVANGYRSIRRALGKPAAVPFRWEPVQRPH